MSKIEEVATAIENVAEPSVRYFGDNIVARVRATGEILYEGRDPDEAVKVADAWFMKARARAAIEAMREPSKDMIEAGGRFYFPDDAEDCWQVMIDAALTAPPPPPSEAA